MKIWEIVAGSAGVTVGNAGADSIMMKPPQRIRRGKQIPQVGYSIRIGRRRIPTPGFNNKDSSSTNGTNVPS